MVTPVRTVPLETFSDEEVALLSDGATMVVTPYLDTLDQAQQQVALATALRGLVARGVVSTGDPDASPEGDGGVGAGGARGDHATYGPLDLHVRGDVGSAMLLRGAAGAVVAVARTTDGGQDYWYAHVVDEVTLLEGVTVEGLHTFALARSEDLSELLVSAAVHGEALDGVGTPMVLPTAPAAEPEGAFAAAVGLAYLRADVVVVDRVDPDAAHPTLTGIFSGPLGSWSCTATPGAAALARPESVEALRTRCRELAALATTTRQEAAS